MPEEEEKTEEKPEEKNQKRKNQKKFLSLKRKGAGFKKFLLVFFCHRGEWF